MGKKHPRPHQWTVRLTSSYHRDREQRIARAYELIIPLVSQPLKSQLKEEARNEPRIADRHLRTRVQ
jgi:hypothetical protein